MVLEDVSRVCDPDLCSYGLLEVQFRALARFPNSSFGFSYSTDHHAGSRNYCRKLAGTGPMYFDHRKIRKNFDQAC